METVSPPTGPKSGGDTGRPEAPPHPRRTESAVRSKTTCVGGGVLMEMDKSAHPEKSGEATGDFFFLMYSRTESNQCVEKK